MNSDPVVGYSDVLARYERSSNEEYQGRQSANNSDASEKRLQYKFRIFRLDDSAEVKDFEDIMTKLFNKESYGVVLGEDPYWNKDGVYQVALRWAEFI